jgi:hypothetical protein
MRTLAFFLAAVACCQLRAAETVDLNRIDRYIDKLPKLVADDPLYGLVVFGSEAQEKVWMVLDKTSSELPAYDVLYVDLNFNGDLSEPSERFTAANASPESTVFALPDYTDSSGVTHTDFKLRVTLGETPIFMVSVNWRGDKKYGGGYAEVPDDGYMRFAESPQKAPIVWMNGDGPFRFQHWLSGQLRIGRSDYFKVFLGQSGVGRHSFSAFQCYALPEDEVVLATLIYTDQEGGEKRIDYELQDRC